MFHRRDDPSESIEASTYDGRVYPTVADSTSRGSLVALSRPEDLP
jgi:hypothetical protein